MYKPLKALFLTFVLLSIPLAPMVNAQTPSNDAAKTSNVKSAIAKRLADKKTKVKVKLNNGDELKGRIETAGEDQFSLTEDKTGRKIDIAYSDVSKVSGRGGLSTGAKIAIIAGVAVGVIAIVAIVAIKNFDPFEGGITAR